MIVRNFPVFLIVILFDYIILALRVIIFYWSITKARINGEKLLMVHDVAFERKFLKHRTRKPH